MSVVATRISAVNEVGVSLESSCTDSLSLSDQLSGNFWTVVAKFAVHKIRSVLSSRKLTISPLHQLCRLITTAIHYCALNVFCT